MAVVSTPALAAAPYLTQLLHGFSPISFRNQRSAIFGVDPILLRRALADAIHGRRQVLRGWGLSFASWLATAAHAAGTSALGAPARSHSATLQVAFTFPDSEGVWRFEFPANITMIDLQNELRSRCALSAAQAARLFIGGLQLHDGAGDVRVIHTQAQWRAALNNMKSDSLCLSLVSGPIDFEATDYRVAGRSSGAGASGAVHRCMDMNSGFIFGVKVIPTLSKSSGMLKEAHALCRLHHDNVVGYLGAVQAQEGLCIFMEYCPHGSLRDAMADFGSFSEALVQNLTFQLFLALSYLHSVACVHRDIKPENMLLDGSTMRLKLCDFGLAEFVSGPQTQSSAQTLVGTPAFMAPEVIKEGFFGHRSDVWSAGCSVLQMLTGGAPLYDTTAPMALLYRVGQCRLAPNLPPSVSVGPADFLRQCFSEWDTRPDAAALLRHSFLSEAGPSASARLALHGSYHLPFANDSGLKGPSSTASSWSSAASASPSGVRFSSPGPSPQNEATVFGMAPHVSSSSVTAPTADSAGAVARALVVRMTGALLRKPLFF
eukprot:NODE_484_length_2196_cov_14.429436_g445_i0.p1 GENE.NODE_484_length_2196_cov_14.429436_g445_i0~~NODE_484_length_2196_cov_14.429436_g445_i0.p1  ORF type:complete len:545 (+),score=72.06 NODE_484_length_2196_cov_14.429436_g445_i0:136-1770(+)